MRIAGASTTEAPRPASVAAIAARLGAGPGDRDAQAAERPRGGQPAELVVERGHAADDGDRGGADAAVAHPLGDVRERAPDRALIAVGAAHDDRGGLVGRAAARDELLGDPVERADAHVEAERAREGGERRPVDERLGLGRILVAGDEGDRARHAPLGDRDARVGGGGDPARDRGDDLERHARPRRRPAPPRRRGRRRTGRRPSGARRSGRRARARSRAPSSCPAGPACRRRSCRRR